MKLTEKLSRGLIQANCVTAETVKNETYFNLIRLCDITGWSDPIAALSQTKRVVDVTRDECGNILTGQFAGGAQ